MDFGLEIFNYLLSFEVFDLFNNLHKFMPDFSINGFIQTRKKLRERQDGYVCKLIYNISM